MDFTAEVERSLRVLDEGAVAVFGAKSGVQPQSETGGTRLTSTAYPHYHGEQDGPAGADFVRVVKEIQHKLNAACRTDKQLSVLKIFFGRCYRSYRLESACMERCRWKAFVCKDIPPELIEEATYWRQNLLEQLALADEAIFAKYTASEMPGVRPR